MPAPVFNPSRRKSRRRALDVLYSADLRGVPSSEMLADTLASYDGQVPPHMAYAVEVVDCTSDPHGVYGLNDYIAFPDTRMPDEVTENDGGGYGHMMFYAASDTGEVSRYRWSVNTGSAGTYTVAQRPVTAVRIVP